MRKSLIVTTLFLLCLGITFGYASATTVQITVDQDVGLNPNSPDANYNGSTLKYLWVGNPGQGAKYYESMFGFDLTDIITGIGADETLQVNSITFTAWHNYQTLAGNVEIGLGTSDSWNADTATWNNSFGKHGASLDSVYINSNPSWYRNYDWDVSSVDENELLDGYITFYLFTTPTGTHNWHLFEPEEYGANNEAYLTIDYDIIPSPVPLPASLGLLASAIAGLLLLKRKTTRN
ncbi:MAG: DNRLRE domain-containing protein [Deltaproteobacteria bacterium]|nr:DNRLRE domain-containing protein [Deltaproteobacteria bacterium]